MNKIRKLALTAVVLLIVPVFAATAFGAGTVSGNSTAGTAAAGSNASSYGATERSGAVFPSAPGAPPQPQSVPNVGAGMAPPAPSSVGSPIYPQPQPGAVTPAAPSAVGTPVYPQSPSPGLSGRQDSGVAGAQRGGTVFPSAPGGTPRPESVPGDGTGQPTPSSVGSPIYPQPQPGAVTPVTPQGAPLDATRPGGVIQDSGAAGTRRPETVYSDTPGAPQQFTDRPGDTGSSLVPGGTAVPGDLSSQPGSPSSAVPGSSTGGTQQQLPQQQIPQSPRSLPRY